MATLSRIRKKNQTDALYLESQEGHTDIVRTLLKNGAKIDAKDWTALIGQSQQGVVFHIKLTPIF